VRERNITPDPETASRIADAGLSALLRDQRDAWASDAGEPENANYYAALVEGVEALESRAALAEARLAALWTMDRERWNAGLYLQEFNTVEDLADALRARALGCNVEELPERSGRAAVPEVAP